MTVENDSVVIRPLWFWRQVVRLPVVRIPLGDIEGASKITIGIKFEVPSNTALDGTRFYAWAMDVESLQPLIELLQRRGILVEKMPYSERWRGVIRDQAVAARPGWIWRDRGRLGFLESVVGLAIALVVLYLLGFFSTQRTLSVVVAALFVALCAWGWAAGHRWRTKVRERNDGG